MRLLLAVLLWSVTGAAVGAQPTKAAMQRAFDQNKRTVVRVIGPRASGPGVLVGAEGQVLTSVAYVGLRDAQVEFEGARYAAQVLIADAYQGIALIQISRPGGFPAAAVRHKDGVFAGEGLLAIRLSRQGPLPRVIRTRRAAADGARAIFVHEKLLRGTPVFDGRGKLVGIAATRTRVVPVGRVRRALVSEASAG